MSRWEDTAVLQRLDGSHVFILLQPLTYVSTRGVAYTVEAGFGTDGATIPGLFRALVGPPIGGEYTEPAILHDALCRSGLFSLRGCDRLMDEAMEAHGTPEKTINSIMLGLNISRLWRRKRPIDPQANIYLRINNAENT